MDERLNGRLRVDASTDTHAFACRWHPADEGGDEHYFFCVLAGIHPPGRIVSKDFRSFWIDRDGAIFAVSRPHGSEEPREFEYYREKVGDETAAANLLDGFVYAFADAPDYAGVPDECSDALPLGPSRV